MSGYTTLTNPTTGQSKTYPGGTLTPSIIQQMAAQGYTLSSYSSTPSAVITTPPPASIPTNISSTPAPEGSIAWYQQQGIPLTLGGVLTQPQVQAAAITANPALADARPVVTTPNMSMLNSFKSVSDTYNLLDIAQSGTPGQLAIAKQTWPDQDWNYLEYAARPIFDISTKEGFAAYNKLSPEKQQLFRPVMDVTIDQYAQMTDRQRLSVKSIVAKEVSPAVYEKLGSGTKGYATSVPTGWQEKVQSGSMIAAEVIVPGLYLSKNWNSIGSGAKALNIVVDVVSIIPFGGAAVRGARGITEASRLARVSGAIKGVSAEALAQVRWPVDLIVHPIATTKGMVVGLRTSERNIASLVENVFDPRKLPEAVITTTDGTVRLPVKAATSEKQAIEIRDKIMQLVADGKQPIVRIGNLEVEVVQSPLMKEVKGGIVHATPSGESFIEGTRVATKPGMPTSEQGLFFSHEPLPRFVEVSAFGKTGENPVFIIISKDTAAKAIETGKIYRKTAEMESTLPVGTKVYAPKQRLYTRVGSEQNIVEIWLDKPLSKWQIAKLKSSGLWESVRTIVTPSIKIKKLPAVMAHSEMDELAKIIGRSDTELATRIKRTNRVIREGRYASSATRSISRIGTRTDRVSVSRLRERYGVSQRAARELPSRARAETERAARIDTEARQTRADYERETPRIERISREERAPREDRLPREERLPIETRLPREERLAREERSPREERLSREERLPKEGKTSKTPRITLPETKGESGKKRIITGTVAWKQGLFYKVAVIQNRKLIVLTTKEKPEGVPIVKGIKSAFKTLTRKGAYFPPEAKYDMGIMDVKITKKGKQIRFMRDIKRKTHGNYIKGEPELIVKS